MATLSIALNSSDGLIIWRDADNPIIQEHMENRHDEQYLSNISNSKDVQISDENIETNSKFSISNKVLIVVIIGVKNTMMHMISGPNYLKKKKIMNGKRRYYISYQII